MAEVTPLMMAGYNIGFNAGVMAGLADGARHCFYDSPEWWGYGERNARSPSPFEDEIVAKNGLCFWPLGSLPGQQGAPVRDSVPAYAELFSMTPEERVALISLIDSSAT